MPYFNPSYTARDYDSIKQYLINLVPTLTDNWTDFNESDLGTTMIELMSAFGDLMSYQIDMQALENYLGSVQQRSNAQNILKLVGYYMSGYQSATCTGQFTLVSPIENNVTIPAYTQLSTGGANPVYYATQNDIVFDANSSVNVIASTPSTPVPSTPISSPSVQTVSLWQGTVQDYTIKYTDIASDGTYTLSDQSIDASTLRLQVNGVVWTQVTDVYFQVQTGQIYSIQYVNDYPTIIFSPSWQTYINEVSPNVELTYVTTLGPSGAIGANSINTIVSPILDSTGVLVTSSFSVTNTNSSVGGSLPETIDHSREVAPTQAFSDSSVITIDDYITQAKKYAGVYDAMAIDVNTPNSGITETMYVRVVVVPSGFGQPTQTMLSGIQTYLTERALPAMTIDVIAPTYYTIDFNVNVYILNKDQSQSSSVQSTVIGWLESYFNPSNTTFNTTIRWSTLVTGIQNSSKYIQYIEMISPVGDISIPSGNYPLLGNVTVNVNLV